MIKNPLEWPRETTPGTPFDVERDQFTFETMDQARAWYERHEFHDTWCGERRVDEPHRPSTQREIAFSFLCKELHIGMRSRNEPMWEKWANYLSYYGAKIYCPAVAVHMAQLPIEIKEKRLTYKQGSKKGAPKAGNEAYQKLAARTGCPQVNVGYQVECEFKKFQAEGKPQPLQWAVREIADKYELKPRTVQNYHRDNGPYVLL